MPVGPALGSLPFCSFFHVFLLGTVLTPTNAILFNNLGSFGIGLGVIWDRVGISLGSSWGRSGISLKVFREHFEHVESILEACDAMPNRSEVFKSEVIIQLNICCHCDAMAALNPP